MRGDGTFRPRIIRRVMKRDRFGKPKVVRDRRDLTTAERIVAKTDKPCSAKCHRQNHDPADMGMIMAGTAFIRISDQVRGRRTGAVFIPDKKDYHLDCLPEQYQPMRRFFE